MDARHLNSEDAQPMARGRMSFRFVAGVVVALVVAIVVAAFLFRSITDFVSLFERGIRRDALRLIAIRDLSFVAVMSCGGYLLCSFISKRMKRARVASAIL